MTTKERKAFDAIEMIDALTERFINVIDGAPYWNGVYSGEKFSRLSFDGDEATLIWPEAESGYEGSCSLDTNKVTIPLDLLFLSDDDLAKWKTEQRVLYDQKQAERKTAEARAKEQQERAIYESLKSKFG